MPSDAFPAWLARVEATLDSALPASEIAPARLHAAMRHAVLGGGKRLRPLLTYAAGQACGAALDQLDAPAAAVELIHAYSLVHDDLPAMDDDVLRRGRPTVHVAFDEATAILAGDALQSLAFAVLAQAPVDATLRVRWLHALAEASGAPGMCGGQALDMDATGAESVTVEALERLHALKTGALIRVAVRLGATAGRADRPTIDRLDAFAADLGLAFQIRDDLLDVEGDSAELGKTAGKDQAQAKATYPALMGVEATRQRLAALSENMNAQLAYFDERADALRELAALAVHRRH